MKITLEKRGGMAALKFRPKVVDASSLPADDAAKLAKLVAAAKSAEPAADAEASEHVRDAMTYKIIIADGADTATLSQSDGSLTPAFSALLDWLNKQPGG